jgi:hypothetical protein
MACKQMDESNLRELRNSLALRLRAVHLPPGALSDDLRALLQRLERRIGSISAASPAPDPAAVTAAAGPAAARRRDAGADLAATPGRSFPAAPSGC